MGKSSMEREVVMGVIRMLAPGCSADQQGWLGVLG